MGPPSRPSDKPTDLNELSDVLQGSGIDLREEEAAMLRPHAAPQQPYHHQDTSFSSHFSNSFNSSGSGSPTTSSFPRNDFNVYSHNAPGDRKSFYGAGTFNQPPVPYQSTEERAKQELERADRRRAETLQYHLNHPFLYTGPLQKRIDKHANSHHLQKITYGHYVVKKGAQPKTMNVAGPDGHEKLVLLDGQDLITNDSNWVELLTLLSLATQERIRGFLEDAAALAKSRSIASNGIVPGELQDLAIGNGKAETVPALPTPSNSAVSPQIQPLKRSYADVNAPPTPVSNGNQSPATTIAFPNRVAESLRESALQERSWEEERIAKRRRRAATATAAPSEDASRAGSVAPDAAASGANQRAPDPEPKKAGTKKEQRKKEEAKATEAQQHAATNKTMNMALGMGGALGGKKLSWMTGGTGGGSTSFSRPTSINAGAKAPSKSAAPVGSSLPAGRKWGEFKETGSGIEMRDVIAALENDGKEKKAMQKAYTRLGRKY
ncbi:MAG: hypothetical protein Q9191_005659 [Dirinaria sp. TL-2023a]